MGSPLHPQQPLALWSGFLFTDIFFKNFPMCKRHDKFHICYREFLTLYLISERLTNDYRGIEVKMNPNRCFQVIIMILHSVCFRHHPHLQQHHNHQDHHNWLLCLFEGVGLKLAGVLQWLRLMVLTRCPQYILLPIKMMIARLPQYINFDVYHYHLEGF